MRHVFILDANILMLLLLANEKPHADARDLWRTILRNCHGIVLSEPLYRQYKERWKERKHKLLSQSAGISVGGLVWELLLHQEKATWVDVGADNRSSKQVRHHGDWFLPIMANVSGAKLVSMDAGTRRDMDGLTIKQALKLAREKSNGET